MADKFGTGAFSSGSKFSGFAGDSSDITIGTKSTINVSTVVSTNFGVTSNFQLGPTFTYFGGYPKTFPGAETINKYLCEYKYYGAKQVIYNTADSGSTECLTRKAIKTQDGFDITTGFDTVAKSGVDAIDSYEKYINSIESTARLYALANVLANIATLSVSLSVEDDYKDNIAQTAVQISSNLISVAVSFTAMVQLINKKSNFLENITPRSVISGDPYNGLFFGCRALHPTKSTEEGYATKTTAITMRDSIEFAVSDKDEPFQKFGSMQYGILKQKPNSLMTITDRGMYAAFPTNIELLLPSSERKNENKTTNQAVFRMSRAEDDTTKIVSESDKILLKSTDIGTKKTRSALGLTNSHGLLNYQKDNAGSMLVVKEKSTSLGLLKDGKFTKTIASFKEDYASISGNDKNYVKMEKNTTEIHGGGASILLSNGDVVIGGILKVISDSANNTLSPVVTKDELTKELDEIEKQFEDLEKRILPPRPFGLDEAINPPPPYVDNEPINPSQPIEVAIENSAVVDGSSNSNPPPYRGPIGNQKLEPHYQQMWNSLRKNGRTVEEANQVVWTLQYKEICRVSHLNKNPDLIDFINK